MLRGTASYRTPANKRKKSGKKKKIQIPKKIYRTSRDFYTDDDLRDPDPPVRLNLTINDFNKYGHVCNPRAPCVATTIDPDYIKDAKQLRVVRKFCMKSDILKLRELTRKKFTIYAAQERYLEKKRETEHNEQVYQRISKFHTFADAALEKMESAAFTELMQANEALKNLQEQNIADELKIVTEEHQRILMQVQDIYRRFLFLLKLICYFDIATDQGSSDDEHMSLVRPPSITELNLSDKHPAGQKEIEHIQNYMDKVVRPYLAQRRHLNAETWIRGYERARYKISKYSRRFSQVALLNHIFSMVHEKFEKTYAKRIEQQIYLRNPSFMKERAETLKTRAINTMQSYMADKKRDKLNLKLDALMPVILKSIEETMNKRNGNEQSASKETTTTIAAKSFSALCVEHETTLSKTEKIQSYVLNLLNAFDGECPDLCKQMEKQVRRRMQKQKELSRRALVQQTRMHGWIAHFKKHATQRQQ